MRFRKLFAVFPLVASLLCLVSSARAQVSEISASWNDFARGVSVYDVLGNLGVVDVVDVDGGRITVLWDGVPTVCRDGEILENLKVVYGDHRLQVLCLLPGRQGHLLRAEFRLNIAGNLVVVTSDGFGYDGSQFVIDSADGTVLAQASCQCFGNSAIKCTDAECDNNKVCVKMPSTEERNWCQWRASAGLSDWD